MINKLKRYLRVARIDICIYAAIPDGFESFPEVGAEVQKQAATGGRALYFVNDNGRRVHNSYLFDKLRVLRLIRKRGPAIGDCVTVPDYKGRSIYPFVINRIAAEQFSGGIAEVFMIVNSDNPASIRGIEKAGFRLRATVRARRFLFWYFRLEKAEY